MSAGDVRVLHQEQESQMMPAWKREILERRKAKGGGPAAAVNGEVTAGSGSNNKDPGRTYTITPAGRRSPESSPAKTKDPAEHGGDDGGGGAQESLVLQESLGPLQENPFIKLEKERKRRQDRENASRPVQHILELYGSVPGIRTIRAENIIIIESDPDYFPEASRLQQNGVSAYSSLGDLLDRRGSPVTEIRAREVVIYDSTLSKSEENLSSLGRPGAELTDLAGGQGRVSRMLQKFDRNYGKLQPKSRSTENLLDLEGTRVRPRPRPSPKPDVVPKSPTSPLHIPGPQAPATDAESNHTSVAAPPNTSSFRGRSITINPREEAERSTPSKPVRERDWDGTDGSSKPPKVPCSPERHHARADSPVETSCSALHSSPSGSFEIRPAPRPDPSQLPADDVQARALANLRLQSRNSFTVVPKARLVQESVSSPPGAAPSVPAVPETPSSPTVPSPVIPPPTPPTSKRFEADRASRVAKSEIRSPPSPSSTEADPQPEPPPDPAAPPPEEEPPTSENLPVTNIDDVLVEPSPQPRPSPVVQRKGSNTFTVVPKRKQEAQPGSQEPQDTGPPAAAAPSQAPYAQLGTLLKKRYPAVEEIEVIGGYLSLGRSCLSKTGSVGKKLKISFNESSLHSTFEYPSESSVWDSGEEDEEDDEGKRDEEVQGGGTETIRIPRPSYTSSPTHTTTNSSDLSSYTPKHSVEFSAWQDHKLDDSAFIQGPRSPPAEMSQDVMLTPADSSTLSDFSSEPALYF
ncbi:taperin [Denticeps clupeoides]|uniref:taperin n=1 Tax=Denticeps clupeoides TaxID=299321 RepID=UPI0010A3F97F|nr:taperin [Denticeps clupeoides]